MKLLLEPARNFNELVVLFDTFGLVCPPDDALAFPLIRTVRVLTDEIHPYHWKVKAEFFYRGPKVPGEMHLVGIRNKNWDRIDPNLDPDLIVEDDNEWNTYVAQTLAYATGAFAVPKAKGNIKQIIATADLARDQFVVYVEAAVESIICTARFSGAWDLMFIDDLALEPVEETSHAENNLTLISCKSNTYVLTEGTIASTSLLDIEDFRR